MGGLRRFWVRLRRTAGVTLGENRFERDLDEEIRLHLEAEVADRVRSGMDPARARQAALRDFGGVLRQKEEARSVARLTWFDDLRRDLGLALRALGRTPGSSIAAIATLALGVGATTATFSAVRGVILRPLPYPAPDRLAVAWERNATRQRWSNSVSVTNFEAFVERNRTFASLTALIPHQLVIEHQRPERVRGTAVSAAWFDVVGVRPALGRAFTPDEAVAGTAVIVLSDDLWRHEFGADPTVIGRPIQFQEGRLTVVGVMPRGFAPPAFGWVSADQRYWVPFAPGPDSRPWGRSLLVLGRLEPGRTTAQAESDLAAIMAVRAVEDPDANKDWSATVRSLHEQVVGEVRTPLLVLSVAVAALLAVTVVNLVAITLARLRRRHAEWALRLALGAARGRLVRQAVAEGLALALIAAPFGALVAFAGVEGLHAARPANLPRAEGVTIDLGMAGFAALVAIGATMLAGVVSASRLPGRALARGVGSLARRVTPLAKGGRLVVAEIAIALVLSIGAGLAMRSFVHLRSTDLGFDPKGVTAFRVTLPERYQGPARWTFYQTLVGRLDRLAPVERAGLVSVRPLGGTLVATSVLPADRTLEKKDAPVADVRLATAGYFAVLGIRFAAGAYPEAPSGAELAVVITRSLADHLWPGRDPVGQRLLVNLDGGISARVAAIVGDARLNGPAVDPRPTLYFPLESGGRQAQPGGAAEAELDLLVRARRSDDRIAALVTGAVWGIDPTLAVYQIESLLDLVGDAIATDRVTFWLLAGFSFVALSLAAAGVAGVLLVEVGERRRELGVRLALGATTSRLRGAIVRTGLRFALIGIALGLCGAVALTRFMTRILHGVQPIDLPTYLIVVVTVLLVALAASYFPARRATEVDPLEVLRTE